MGKQTIGSNGKLRRNTFGPNLRYLREKLNLSAEEVAARIELENSNYTIIVSANHLHKVERQEKPLTDNLLLAYLEALNLDLADFILQYEVKHHECKE